MTSNITSYNERDTTLINTFSNDNPLYDDLQLLRDLAAGNEMCMDILFDRYYTYLCQVSYTVVGDQNMAEDIVQDLFVWIWTNRSEMSLYASLSAYLRRATINRSLNYLRKKESLPINPELLDAPDSQLNGQEMIEYDELLYKIYASIDQLPPQCQTVFKKSRYEQKTYQEIADEMHLSIKTVGNHIAKALKTLRAGLRIKETAHGYQWG